MRKTFLLLCQLERVLIEGFVKGLQDKIRLARIQICDGIKTLGKKVLKEMAIFLSRYKAPLPHSKRRFCGRLESAWCSTFNSIREYHKIKPGSTNEFLTLEEWVSWAQRLKIA